MESVRLFKQSLNKVCAKFKNFNGVRQATTSAPKLSLLKMRLHCLLQTKPGEDSMKLPDQVPFSFQSNYLNSLQFTVQNSNTAEELYFGNLV